jgi:hypothetical protein
MKSDRRAMGVALFIYHVFLEQKFIRTIGGRRA